MQKNNFIDICDRISMLLGEDTTINTSTDPVLVPKMFDLLSRLICANQYAKVLHWNSSSTGEHLGYDHIYETLDDCIDEFAEKYFMSRGFIIGNPLLKAQEYASGDFGELLNAMNFLVQDICSMDSCDESMKSTVSGIGESVQQCMGFLRQSKHDAQ